ncbi:MAG: hypothetical protein ACI4J2_00945 [Ruminococcus sp.]
MNLLAEEFKNYVQPTTLTRKLTLDGDTKAYPVYRVRLECLYYNDQNDRIATYITQYKTENGLNAFQSLDMNAYNNVVEQFIVQSNPASIEKTQMNIELVGQREPGVILSDGRVIDGNRRFTCLRRLAAENPAFCWFETVILNERMRDNKKRIKMLELAIQHGEEKKVDYNPVDRLVGIYQDIIKTKLLTVEEYAQSINETEAEVKSKMEHALLLVEFLEYIGLPEHYHIARDYQIVSVLGDLSKLLKKAKKDTERQMLKEVIFNNILMKTIGDSRKYIRSINAMMDTNIYTTYLKKQTELGDILRKALTEQNPRNMEEFNVFISANSQLADEMRNMFDSAVLKSKKRETKARPSQSVSKSITMLRDVDTRIFETLNDAEREKLAENVEQLLVRVNTIKEELTGNTSEISENTPAPYPITETVSTPFTISAQLPPKMPSVVSVSTFSQKGTKFSLAVRHIDEPMVVCPDMAKPITNLAFSLNFRLEQPLPFQKDTAVYHLFFLNEDDKIVSDINTVTISSNQTASCNFILSSDMSMKKVCYLAIRSEKDPETTLQQKIPFCIQISFAADFGF